MAWLGMQDHAEMLRSPAEAVAVLKQTWKSWKKCTHAWVQLGSIRFQAEPIAKKRWSERTAMHINELSEKWGMKQAGLSSGECLHYNMPKHRSFGCVRVIRKTFIVIGFLFGLGDYLEMRSLVSLGGGAYQILLQSRLLITALMLWAISGQTQTLFQWNLLALVVCSMSVYMCPLATTATTVTFFRFLFLGGLH